MPRRPTQTARAATPSRRAAPPAIAEPMYASTGDALPADAGWRFEPKYDGVRVLAHVSPDGVRLVTRNGRDKAAQFPEIAGALRTLARRRRRALVLDGEVVPQGGTEGAARFQALQARTHVTGAADIAARAAESPAVLVAFDLLVDGDTSLLDEPFATRRQRLARVVGRTPPPGLQLGASHETGGARLLARARRAGWEGIIAKRADAPYRPGARSRDWLKLKVDRRQEFVVGGWTEPRRTRPHLGALLLGYHDADGKLVYAGHAGGGLTHEGLRAMRARLERLARRTPPFADAPRANETVHWVRPTVVVEVRFAEWTDDGRLRQPIVLGVRDDKAARDVVREPESVQSVRGSAPTKREETPREETPREETPRATKTATRKSTRRTKSGDARPGDDDVVAQLAAIEANGGDGTVQLPDGVALRVTSLGKPYFPKAKLTKGDLLRHYARSAHAILPTIADRPLVLRRFPRGAAGPSFFQQNAPDAVPDGVRVETIAGDDGTPQRRFVGGDLATLLHLAQLGAISVDPWNARVGSLDRVDWVVLDLDPGDGVAFATVVEVARAVKDALDALKLDGRLKTSGKRGLHVFVPQPRGSTEDAAVALARRVAERVVEARPDVATVERSVDARPAGTVYVDYLQNIVAKPVAAAWCVRATPGATVSTPLPWDALTDDLDPRAFTIATVRADHPWPQ